VYWNNLNDEKVLERVNFEPITPEDFYSKFLHHGYTEKKKKDKKTGNVKIKKTFSSKPPLDASNFLALGQREKKLIKNASNLISKGKQDLKEILKTSYSKATMICDKHNNRLDVNTRVKNFNEYKNVLSNAEKHLEITNTTLYNFRISVGVVMKQRLSTLVGLLGTKKLDYKILNNFMKDKATDHVLRDLQSIQIGQYLKVIPGSDIS